MHMHLEMHMHPRMVIPVIARFARTPIRAPAGRVRIIG
jgi:hypothetical protein